MPLYFPYQRQSHVRELAAWWRVIVFHKSDSAGVVVRRDVLAYVAADRHGDAGGDRQLAHRCTGRLCKGPHEIPTITWEPEQAHRSPVKAVSPAWRGRSAAKSLL